MAITGNSKKRVFVLATTPSAQGRQERDRRKRDLAYSDAVITVEFLNSSIGTEMYRRVLSVRQELEELGVMLECVCRGRQEAKDRRKNTYTESKEELLKQLDEARQRAELYEQFRVRHNKLNQVLSRYSFVPVLAYNLSTGVWRSNSIPKSVDEHTINVSDGRVSVQVNEAAAVAALARLAANHELYKIRLCQECGKRWLISKRTIDRFCGDECRDKSYASSHDLTDRKAVNQQTYRDRLKTILIDWAGEYVRTRWKKPSSWQEDRSFKIDLGKHLTERYRRAKGKGRVNASLEEKRSIGLNWVTRHSKDIEERTLQH